MTDTRPKRNSNPSIPFVELRNAWFRPALFDEEPGTAPAQGGTPAVAAQEDFLKSLTDKVRDSITSATKPITDRLDKMETEIQEAKKPQTQASSLFGGGAPAIRQGESALCENRSYSFSRVFQAIQSRDFSNAKLEMEFSNKLKDTYGSMAGKGNSFMAPMSSEHMVGMDDDFRREVSQACRMGVSTFDPEQIRWAMGRAAIQQDLSLWDDTQGGALLGTIRQGELIDILRAKEILSRLGVTEFSFPPNGRIQWPRITGDMTAYWVGEGQTITESDIATGMLNMSVRKMAAITTVSNDLLRFQSISSEMLIRNSIAEQFARKLDYSALYGIGSEVDPKGLVNFTATGEVIQYAGLTSPAPAGISTNGNTLEPQDMNLMAALVAENNLDIQNFAYVMRPRLWAGIKTRRNDMVAAGDQAGAFTFQTEAAREARLSGRVAGFGVVDSTTIRGDQTKNSGTGLTEVFGGVWSELLLGRSGVLEFEMDPYAGVAGTNFKNDMVSIRGIQYVDVKPRRPEAFVYYKELLNH